MVYPILREIYAVSEGLSVAPYLQLFFERRNVITCAFPGLSLQLTVKNFSVGVNLKQMHGK